MRRAVLAPSVLSLVLTLSACGGTDEGGGAAAPPQPAPAAGAQDFPTARAGMSVQDLAAQYPEGPVLAPAVRTLKPGRFRFAFALVDNAMKQVPGAAAAVYVAAADGTGLRGPFVARSESPGTEPRSRARPAGDVSAPYVVDLALETGTVSVLALARIDGRLVATAPASFEVGEAGAAPPEAGGRTAP